MKISVSRPFSRDHYSYGVIILELHLILCLKQAEALKVQALSFIVCAAVAEGRCSSLLAYLNVL